MHRILLPLLLVAVVAAPLSIRPALAEEDALIPRDLLFGNPDRALVRLSPDGSLLAWVAPVGDVMNVWVAPIEDLSAARAVTNDTKRGIRRYQWCHDNRRILFMQDKGGDENWQVKVLDLVTNRVKALTPPKGVAARISGLSHKHPRHVIVSVNDRNPQLHDLWKVDLVTGEKTLHMENPGFLGFVMDDDYRVRFAARPTRTGGRAVMQRTPEGEWKPFVEIAQEDSLTTNVIGFGKDGKLVYMVDSRGRDTAALKVLDPESGEEPVTIAADDRADVSGVSIHPTEKYVEAVSVNHARTEWTVLDKKLQADLGALKKVDDGDIEITSRSSDDRTWIVVSTRSDGPVRYYLYDRPSKKARFLFTNRSSLEKLKLAPMRPVIVKSRDGMDLVSYLTMPRGVDRRPAKPLPFVLLVHGGPWARDSWGYNPVHQWLANRGYAVMSVNFRGSTGFGKKFLNAANLQWGRKMHDDLLDAVAWAEAQGIADPKRTAILGGSYGGYAALAGLTMTPDVFAAGVSIVGPSNLNTLLASIPPYWKPMLDMMAARVGDPRTEEGRKLLEERSPLTYVANIRKPLLIGQGKNDPRVKEAESQQIVDAMIQRGIPVTYVLYPDEGHGFRKPANSIAFWAIVEAFFGETLGGRVEPIGNALEGSSAQVRAGAEHVPGLQEAGAGK